jgi:hypothetical protein
MGTIDWPAIGPYCATEATALDLLLLAVMASRAKGLELTEPEFLFIAAMWNDMVSTHCWCDYTMTEAPSTQWL